MKAQDFPPNLLVAWADDRDVGFGVGSQFFIIATLAAPMPISEWAGILGEEWREYNKSPTGLRDALRAAVNRARATYGVDDEFIPPRALSPDTNAILLTQARDE